MSSIPPPGYDDTSVVPDKLLRNIVGKFEKELKTIKSIYQQHQAGEPFAVHSKIDREFSLLQESAAELGPDYKRRIDALIAAFNDLKKTPDLEKINHLIVEIESFKTFLGG